MRRNPALWAGFFFACGIVLSFVFITLFQPLFVWAVLALVAALLVVFGRRSTRSFLLLTGLFFLLIGLIYGYTRFAHIHPNHLLRFNPREIQAVQGWISEATIRNSAKQRYVLRCRQVRRHNRWQSAQGKILLITKRGSPELHYGDRVQVNGKLDFPPLPSNPGQFNYRRYLNLKGIFFEMVAGPDALRLLKGKHGNFAPEYFLLAVRRAVRQAFDRYFPSTTSNILKALILGERQNLDGALVQRFQKVGVVHVLAISGLHVGFILLIFLIFFGLFPFSYKVRYALTFAALTFFVALVRFKAPVVRASLMAFFYFAVPLSQRKASALNVLAAAGLLILLFDPAQILQAGFQFSFAAVGGIVYGYPHLKAMLPFPFGNTRLSVKMNHWIWQPGLISLSAVLATLPLTYYYFGTIQIGAVFINLIIIPLIGLLVIGALLFAIFSLFVFPFLAGFAFLISGLTAAILKLITFFSHFDWVQIHVAHPSLAIVFLLGLFILFLFRIHQRRALHSAAFCLLLLLLLWHNSGPKHLRLTFLDVGQGDACLIQIPPDLNVLVDSGDRNRWRDYGQRSVVPVCRYYGVKRLRYAVVTHPHSDHYGGMLTVLRTLRVDTLVISPYADSTKGYRRLLQEAKRRNIPIVKRERGQTLNFGENARAYILSPVARFEKVKWHNGREINNSSIVLRVCYGKNAFLLSGDAQKEAEKVMNSFGSFLKSHVLKVGHHGSSTSSTPEFLNLIQPDFAVISVGKHNKFHHPSNKTLHTLQALGIPVLRTDRLGALVFESDGRRVRLVNWRK